MKPQEIGSEFCFFVTITNEYVYIEREEKCVLSYEKTARRKIKNGSKWSKKKEVEEETFSNIEFIKIRDDRSLPFLFHVLFSILLCFTFTKLITWTKCDTDKLLIMKSENACEIREKVKINVLCFVTKTGIELLLLYELISNYCYIN